MASSQNLTRYIVEALGKDIVTGKYAPGTILIEEDLSKTYKASRSITREAVKMLTAKGLISARPRQGTRIEAESQWNILDPDVLSWLLSRKFSLDLLIEFTQMRRAVEPEAAALAAERATDSDLLAITNAIERMDRADNSVEDGLRADIDFHVAIIMATHNRFFQRHKDMIETALRFSIRLTNELQGVKIADFNSHKQTADAILARDAKAAHDTMFAMMDQALTLMLEARNRKPVL